MAKQTIGIGTSANDGTGDTIRTGFTKVNENFTEVYDGKQDTLVSGTNIKTINGSSVLGSGDLTISGSGLQGIHSLTTIPSGYTTSVVTNASTHSNQQLVLDRMYLYPYIPNQTFTTSQLSIYCTAGQPLGVGRILIYSDLDGLPNTKLYESSTLNVTSTGFKSALTSFTFNQGVTYWLCYHNSGSVTLPNISVININQCIPLSFSAGITAQTHIYLNVEIGSAPSTFSGGTLAQSNIPLILITKA